MIKNRDDLDRTLNSFETDVTIVTGGIGENMDSTVYNGIMSGIERELNAIYEKVRTLNDAKDYCRKYILANIEAKEEELTNKLKRLQRLADSSLNITVRNFPVELLPCEEVITDEENIIPPMKAFGGMLETSGRTVSQAEILSVDMDSAFICYKSTAERLAEKSESQSVYISEEPVEDGICENYLVVFKEPKKINYIKIGTVNSYICNPVLIDESANEVPVDISNRYIEPVTASALKFSLMCRNYRTEIMNMAENAVRPLAEDGSLDKKGRGSVTDWIKNQTKKEKTSAESLYRGRFFDWETAKRMAPERNREIKEGEAGPVITQTSQTGYRYIPQMKDGFSSPIVSEKEFIEKPPEFVIRKSSGEGTVTVYDFGISSFNVEYREPDGMCGYISHEVRTGDVGELSVSVDGSNLNGRVSFYIVCGAAEKQILPTEIREIIGEPLKDGGKTAFPINRKYPVTIRENGIETEKQPEDLSSECLGEGVFTIDYTPLDAWSVSVKGDAVKVKLVVKGTSPVTMRNITVNTSGGTGLWNM